MFSFLREKNLSWQVKPTIGYIGCLSEGSRLWLRRQERFMLEKEVLAIQGFYRSYGQDKGMPGSTFYAWHALAMQFSLLSSGLL